MQANCEIGDEGKITINIPKQWKISSNDGSK